jgi:hypothetical protein
MQDTCEGNKHARKHVWFPLKFILDFFRAFCTFGIKLKYSYTIMYDYEKSSLTHELSHIGLFNFSHLSLFRVNVIWKN